VGVVAAFMVAVGAGVYTALLIYQPVIKPLLDTAPPFLIAIILAFLLDPLIDRLEKIGCSRDFAVVIVGLTFVVAFALVGFLLVPRIADQAGDLTKNYTDIAGQAQTQINGILKDHAPLLRKFHLPTTASAWTKQYADRLQVIAGNGITFVAGALAGALSRILWLIIIPLSTFWLLKDFDRIKAKIVHLTPERHREKVICLSSAVGGVCGKYVRGMITVAILFSLVAMVALSILRLQYALVIGSVAGLFYLVPYVGVLIISVITGIAAIIQPGHSASYALLLMGLLIVQSYIVFDLFVTPRIVGGNVGVHPVLMLFSLALGARMFGLVGMIIAVPVAASLQVALGQIYPQIYDIVGSKSPVEREISVSEDTQASEST